MSKFYVISGDHGAISNSYDLTDKVKLSKLFITRTEKDATSERKFNTREAPSFTVYENKDQFITAYSVMTYEQKTLHEVILDIPQKLKFDIDAKRYSDNPTDPVFNESVDEFNTMMENIISHIQSIFHLNYDIELPRKNVIMCDSSDASKFSRHIIINGYFVSGHRQAEHFALDVINGLPEDYSKFIDRSVYNVKQNFRITGSHKSGSNRIKTIMNYTHGNTTYTYDIKDTFITHTIDCTKLKNIEHIVDSDELYVKEIELEGSDMIEISKLVRDAGLDKYYQYVNRDGAVLKYNRIRPSACEICQHEHTSNGMFIRVYKTGSHAEVFQYCYRWNSQNPKNKRRLSLGTFVTEYADDRHIASPDMKSLTMLERALNEPYVENKLLVGQLNNVNKYDEPSLKSFELVKTLFVHAGMKMGKTRALKKFISAYFKDEGVATHKIIFLSFRQTFGNNIKSSFPEFTLYSEAKGELCTYRKLIIQIESLYRVDITQSYEYPDLLILDESESILEQLGSGLSKNFSKSYATFEWLLKYSKHVIAMDANLTDRTYNTINAIRGVDDALYHRNYHMNAINDQYYLTSTYGKWVACLRVAIGGDERVAVVVSSLKEAKAIYHMLTQVFPKKKMQLYSSESSNSQKKKDFSDVNNTWDQLDVLIYTPTVSAGVSFEKKHFDKIFAYFTDNSCNAETCVQMLGRVRDVGTKTYFVCLKMTGNNLAEEPSRILKDLTASRDKLFEGVNTENLQVEYTMNGTRSYHKSTYLTVWLENTRVIRVSRNNFARRFIYLIRSVGATASIFDDESFTEHSGIIYKDENGNIDPQVLEMLSDREAAGNEIEFIESRKLVEAPDLSNDDYEALDLRKKSQEELPDLELVAYEKAKLRRLYSYYEPIDEVFITLYKSKAVQDKFINLRVITGDRSVAELIEEYRLIESNYSQTSLRGDLSQQHSELASTFMAPRHKYLHECVMMFGFDNVLDAKYVPDIIIKDAISKKMKEIPNFIYTICSEFMIKSPSGTKLSTRGNIMVDTFINVVKQLLGLMYGIKIKTMGDMIRLEQNSDFAPRGKVVVGKPSL
jgi:hypothetical protein